MSTARRVDDRWCASLAGNVALAAVSILVFAGCSTVAPIERHESGLDVSALGRLDRVIVEDFGMDIDAGIDDSEVGKDFADMVATELLIAGDFVRVRRRGEPAAGALVVGGVIHRYQEGSPTARMLIGFGAGSSSFVATIRMREGGTDTLIGTLVVDSSSWALGGAIAASQDAGHFMNEAAKRVAIELHAARTAKR